MKTSKTVNGKKVTATPRIQSFFEYTFKGDGKYYTTEQGSRSYKNTDFTNFLNYNEDCVDIIESGNDAPRGGKTGDFVNVKFNEKFYSKWGWFFYEIKNEKTRIAEREQHIKDEIEKIGDQEELLRQEFISNPEFLEKIKNRIEKYSSKKWRNWVRMKVANKITKESFSYLYLSASQIRDIAQSI